MLEQIERRLIAAIPRVTHETHITEPIYAIVVQYFGLDSVGDLTPNLRMPTLSRRSELVKQHGDESPHYIWCHDEFDDGLNVIDAEIVDTDLTDHCKKWYEHLSDGSTTLLEFRNAIQNVARKLNTDRSWLSGLPVSDDFVVYPGDMAHEFDDPFGDLSASVDACVIEKLRSQKLIGRETWWKL